MDIPSVNHCILLGKLVTHPTLTGLDGDDRVAVCKLVTYEVWKEKQSTRQRRAEDLHKLVIRGRKAEGFCRRAKKGAYIYIEGEVRNRSSERDGREIAVTSFKVIWQPQANACGSTTPV